MNAINRIILVGNGFDLAHGLATRYADFINWYWEKYLNHLRMCHNRTYSDRKYSANPVFPPLKVLLSFA